MSFEKYVPDEELLRQIEMLGNGMVVHRGISLYQAYLGSIYYYNKYEEDFANIKELEQKIRLFILKNSPEKS